MAIDTSRQREVRLALAYPGERPWLDRIVTYDAATLPTFTDALMRVQADAGIDLRQMDAALAIAGAVAGSVIPIMRSRWMASRAGLAAMFRKPPAIVNDVAARAWALRDMAAGARAIRGSGQFDLRQPGRYALVMLEEGVGCARIDIDDDGELHITESEAGHTDFSATNAIEARIAALLAADGMPASWEQVLMLERDGAALTRATPGLTDAERDRVMAGMPGRFTVNMILATGAWSGAILTGRRAARIAVAETVADFDADFLHRRSFRRIIAGAPRWLIDQSDPVLAGLTALIADRDRAVAVRYGRPAPDHRSIRMRVGSSIAFLRATRKVTASRPSISRWS